MTTHNDEALREQSIAKLRNLFRPIITKMVGDDLDKGTGIECNPIAHACAEAAHQSATGQMKPLVDALRKAATEIDNEIIGPVDAQVHETIRKNNYDTPDDFEHHVIITGKGWRVLSQHIATMQQALATYESKNHD